MGCFFSAIARRFIHRHSYVINFSEVIKMKAVRKIKQFPIALTDLFVTAAAVNEYCMYCYNETENRE